MCRLYVNAMEFYIKALKSVDFGFCRGSWNQSYVGTREQLSHTNTIFHPSFPLIDSLGSREPARESSGMISWDFLNPNGSLQFLSMLVPALSTLLQRYLPQGLSLPSRGETRLFLYWEVKRTEIERDGTLGPSLWLPWLGWLSDYFMA